MVTQKLAAISYLLSIVLPTNNEYYTCGFKADTVGKLIKNLEFKQTTGS